MPQYVITAPNGKKYRITGETKEGALAALRKHLGDVQQPQQTDPAPGPVPPSPAPEMSWGEMGMDVLKGGATGLVKGATGLAGGFGDAQRLTGDVLSWGAGKLGFSPEVQSAAKSVGERIAFPGMGKMPTSADLRKPIEDTVGPLPKAESLPGQIAERVGEFVPAAVGGPGPVGRKVALATVPAVASELAGRAPGVEGSAYQPYVELAAGLATGLPIAAGGGGKALQTMRERAPTQESVAASAKSAYEAIDRAGIVFDPNSVKSAAMKIKSGLANRGWDKLQGGEVAPLLRRVDGLLKGNKVANWTKVDGILKDAKKILRSGADETTKGHVGVIVDRLETLVNSGKITSRSGLSREEINSAIETARELARRSILAREVETMKRRMPGYLAGEESAFRNQFGAYLKSPESKSLTPAEREAFSNVVRREGPLGVAHNMGSRLGQIAGGASGMGVGALTGSALGPLGTLGGAVVGAGVTAGTQAGFRKMMDAITEKAVDDALKTILAGRKAQGQAMAKEQVEALRATIRAALTSEAATRPVRDDWFIQDANGRTYSPTGASPTVPR